MNPAAGHAALEDLKAAPANAISGAVPKPIWAKGFRQCSGKQGCSGQLVLPPDKTHLPHHPHRDPTAGFFLKHAFESPPDLLLQSAADMKHMSVEFLHQCKRHCWPQEIPEHLMTPKPPGKGPCSSLFPKICYRPPSETRKESRTLDPSQQRCSLPA